MMPNPSTLFDRRLHQMRRHRASRHFDQADFIVNEACDRLADRLEDMARTFPLALDLGCHTGQLAHALKGRGGIERLIQTDMAHGMIQRCAGERVVCDEEWLPFADHQFDLVMSAMSLHHVNDLAGCLVQIHRILKPDGLFLAVVPGSQTLYELRDALGAAQATIMGGISPMVSPFMEVRDAGALLQRTGFALPVVDRATLTVQYHSMPQLMSDLRQMGETNPLIERARFIPREVFAMAAAHYAAQHTNPLHGKLTATVEYLTLTAWKPHPSQQQPARRGSGTIDLNQALH